MIFQKILKCYKFCFKNNTYYNFKCTNFKMTLEIHSSYENNHFLFMDILTFYKLKC